MRKVWRLRPESVINEMRGSSIGNVVQAGSINCVNLHQQQVSLVPRQLPAVSSIFIGRTGEMARLTEAVDDVGNGSRIMGISGIGGIGKTALALNWAYANVGRFPDGQLYVNLRGFDPVDESLRAIDVVLDFIDAFGVPSESVPKSDEAKIRLYRTLMANRQVLVVLDNARDSDQVRSLLPGGSSCVTLVTSRNELAGLAVQQGAQIILLDVLSRVQSIELIMYGSNCVEIPSFSPVFDELVGYCAQLPLALSVVAARCRLRGKLSLSVLAEELRDEQSRLEIMDTGDPETSVCAVFSWSHKKLEKKTAQVFELLSLHPGPDFGNVAAATLTGVPLSRMRRFLAALVQVCLISEPEPGRYRFHDLVRLYANSLIQGDVRDEAVDRVLWMYRDQAKEWRNRAIGEGNPHPNSISWIRNERENILAAASMAHDRALWLVSVDIAWAAHDMLLFVGRRSDVEQLFRRAVSSVHELGDLVREAEMLALLAQLLRWHGNYSEAVDLCVKSVAIARRSNNTSVRGWSLIHAGDSLIDCGLANEAKKYFEEAIQIYRECDNQKRVRWCLVHLGMAMCASGEEEEAAALFESLLTLDDYEGDNIASAWVLGHLAAAFIQLHREQDAEDALRKVLELERSSNNKLAQERTFGKLGDLLSFRDANLALENFSEALLIARERGDEDAIRKWEAIIRRVQPER